MRKYVGEQLGNYHVLRLLGEGGQASVYLGEHVYLKSQAALKVRHTVLTEEEQTVFLQEAQTLVRLTHHHIVRVLDFALQDGIPFLVMEYAPHGTLRQRHPKETQLPLDVILPYVKQVASALQYTHDQRLIHRDVKPENMLLSSHDKVLLSDFGLVLPAPQLLSSEATEPMEQSLVGTTSYLAPEQLRGKAQPASDQYALGVVVYEWLCGKPPFRGPFLEVAVQHVSAPPPSLLEQVPDLSPAIEEAVLRALAKEPELRFPCVQDFATALAHASQEAVSPRLTPVLAPKHGVAMGPRPSSMRQLPTGTVTLLFTDIEGSTQLLQRLGDQYIVLLAECRYLLRSAFRQWNGHEVDTQGDEFFVVFANARDAVAAASMAQRLLYTHTWPEGVAVRVRIGMHTGEPVLVPEGYVGIDVHRAARIMSAGHGGQVLLSQRSRGLVEQFLPSDVSLRDVGEHQLKDLQHPEHLFQLVIADLPADFPPLKTLNSLSAVQTSALTSADGSHTEKVYTLAWSPDRRYIASGGHDRTARVWKSTTRLVAITYRGHASSITTLAWSPDGQYIASASLDKSLHVWSALPNEDVPVERRISSYKSHPGMIGAVTWSPDGKRIASTSSGGTDTTVHIWEASTGRTLLIYKGHAYWVRALAWSPDGKFIASGSLREVQVWDVTTGHKVFTYHGHEGWVKAIKWEPDGSVYGRASRIASTGEDKTVQVWSPHKDRALVTYRGHDDWVDSMEWSPDGIRIASVGKDNVIQVWDAASGRNTFTFHGHADSTHAVAWLPDGKHLAYVNGDEVVQVWKGA